MGRARGGGGARANAPLNARAPLGSSAPLQPHALCCGARSPQVTQQAAGDEAGGADGGQAAEGGEGAEARPAQVQRIWIIQQVRRGLTGSACRALVGLSALSNRRLGAVCS